MAPVSKEIKTYVNGMKTEMLNVVNKKVSMLTELFTTKINNVENAIWNRITSTVTDTCREYLNDKMVKIDDVEKSMQWHSEITEEISHRLGSCMAIQEQIIINIKELNQSLQNVTEHVMAIDNEVGDQQQYSKKENLKVKGIPVRDGENTTEILLELFNSMENIKVDYKDISTSHRMNGSNANNNDIIVRFSNRDLKNAIFKEKKQLRRLSTSRFSFPVKLNSLYISEHLTKYNEGLFYEARQLKKRGIVKYVWTYNCQIFVRRDDNSEKFIIRNKEDLNDLL